MTLTTSLPNAITARQQVDQVDQGAYDKAQKQMQQIEDLIINAIGSGRHYVSADYCLEPSVKNLLANKGYVVSYSIDSTSIYW